GCGQWRLRPRRRRPQDLAAARRCGLARERPAARNSDGHAPDAAGRPLTQLLRWAEIDLGAVRENAARIGAHLPTGTRLMAVVPVHLKIDTGMGRFGVSPDDAQSLAKLINDSAGLRLAGTWTHFASAGTDEKMTRAQYERFLRAMESLGVDPGLRHACNSAA